MKSKKSRSLLKTITFRVAATFATMIVFFIFTGELIIALGVGLVDTIVKLFIYYFHERIWDKIDYGRVLDND